MKYRLYDYDLWGNEEDGYEVNNVLYSDIVFDIEEDTTDEDIIKQVKNKERIKDFSIEGEYGYFLYVNYKDVPYCELRPED